MSSELLRRAANQMRTAATEAQKQYASPWHDDGDAVYDPTDTTVADVYDAGDINYLTEHIASWHPAVALAVADWLEREADLGGLGCFGAVAVARAYLRVAS
jgi:hypothetical protein